MSWSSKRHSELAFKEGWEIFEASGSMCNRQGNWPYQVMKLDEEAILESDQDAWKLIITGAIDGKAHHLAALKFLRAEAKPELDLLYRDHLGLLTEQDNWERSILTHDEMLDGYERTIFGKVITNV